MTKTKRKHRQGRSLRFWEKSPMNYYVHVMTEHAPKEICDYLQKEDDLLLDFLDGLVKEKEDFIFLEIGSGTGRYVNLLAERMMKNPSYDEHLKFVLGIDFSLNMIKTNIDLLCSSESKFMNISNNNKKIEIPSILKNIFHNDVKIKNKLNQRIFFINGDASLPFLRVKGIKVVIATMFGTLGNIRYRRKSFIKEISKLSDDIIHIVTGFDKTKCEIGSKRYHELANHGFDELQKINLYDRTDFSSSEGFYSHWFSEKEFCDLVSLNGFKLVKNGNILDRGFYGITKLSKSKLSKIFSSHSKELTLLSSSGDPLIILPLENLNKIPKIPKHLKTIQYRNFTIPILLEK